MRDGHSDNILRRLHSVSQYFPRAIHRQHVLHRKSSLALRKSSPYYKNHAIVPVKFSNTSSDNGSEPYLFSSTQTYTHHLLTCVTGLCCTSEHSISNRLTHPFCFQHWIYGTYVHHVIATHDIEHLHWVDIGIATAMQYCYSRTQLGSLYDLRSSCMWNTHCVGPSTAYQGIVK